ncbi:hypothetical protein WN943_025996 [Citrus x changshan-huyou]
MWIPLDVITEILSLLAVKSLLRFRSNMDSLDTAVQLLDHPLDSYPNKPIIGFGSVGTDGARTRSFYPERITNEIPHLEARLLRNLDKNGIVMLGSWVETGDILVGKLTPQAAKESSYAPEDRLLRAILGIYSAGMDPLEYLAVEFDQPFDNSGNYVEIIACSDGLLVLQITGGNGVLFLQNPSNKKHQTLPNIDGYLFGYAYTPFWFWF